MKTLKIPYFSTLAAGLTLLFSTSTAQAIDCEPAGAACTDPVGFITLTADPGDGQTKKPTFVGLGLFNAVEFQGPISSISNAVIGVSGIQASQFDGMYFVQIASGTNSGLMVDIVSTASGSITLAEDISMMIAVNNVIKIRKHHTIESVFGANNDFGLLGGDSATESDTINLFNADGSVDIIYYLPSPTNLWFNGQAIANTFIIYPDQGVFLRRLGVNTASRKLLGSVKTDRTALTIENGFNLISNVFPVNVTLANSGLNTGDGGTGLLAGDSITEADVVRFFNDQGVLKSYYLVDQQNNTWFDGSALAGDVVIEAGSSFIITRRNSSINWFQNPTF